MTVWPSFETPGVAARRRALRMGSEGSALLPPPPQQQRNALLMYNQDHDETFPPSYNSLVRPEYGWRECLEPYVKAGLTMGLGTTHARRGRMVQIV